MADIISFDRARPRPSTVPDETVPRAFRETPRQAAGRKRNPLRQHAERISLAVTIVGKIAAGRTDELQQWAWGDYDHVAMLRRGADAARFLAEALDGAIDSILAEKIEEKIDTAMAERGLDEPEPA